MGVQDTRGHDEIADLQEEVQQRQAATLAKAQQTLKAANACVAELQAFASQLKLRNKAFQRMGVSTFIDDVKRDCDVVQELIFKCNRTDGNFSTSGEDSQRFITTLPTLDRYMTRWDILKRCRSLVALERRLQSLSHEARRKKVSEAGFSGKTSQELHKALRSQARVTVDVVDRGFEWVDVRTIKIDRLARHMSNCGWSWGDHKIGDEVDPDEWEEVPLAKHVKRLVAAARLNRHDYRIPRIRIILANLELKPQNVDVRIFFDQLTRLDSAVRVIWEDRDSDFLRREPPSLSEAIENLIDNELDHLTSTLNLDHTILIDLISDLTHLQLKPEPWHGRTTKAQIEEERQHGGLMAPTLYPYLQGRRLVCTKEAAAHFHLVLEAVGTETERERGRLLVPVPGETPELSYDAIRRRFSELSTHPFPADTQIPVDVVEEEEWAESGVERAVSQGRLPLVARDVARVSGHREAKLSIFMYGWAAGIATLTSNKEIRGQYRTWVEANRHSDDETGPTIVRLEVTRNLLAKAASKPEAESSDTNGNVDVDKQIKDL